MKQKTELSWGDLTYSIVRGGLVGSVGVTAVTPIMNFTNHVIKSSPNQGFTLKRAFDGVLAYNSSVVPMTAVSLTLNALLTKEAEEQGYQKTASFKLASATLSGMVAGIVGSVPEAVAQAQQLATPKPRATQVVKGVIQNNGFFALGRGIPVMMVRQGLFTAGFVGLMPLFTQEVRKVTGNNLLADLISACACGFIIGPVTAPWNKLRFEKQKDFHLRGNPPSYAEIINQAGAKQLMTGWKPRTLMSACSMFLLHKGREVYDQYSTTPKL